MLQHPRELDSARNVDRVASLEVLRKPSRVGENGEPFENGEEFGALRRRDVPPAMSRCQRSVHRVAECAHAESLIGPLRTAVASIGDDAIRRRARHVVTENARIRQFASALRRADYPELGHLMVDGHASLRDDYATSTPQMDAAVDELNSTAGVPDTGVCRQGI